MGATECLETAVEAGKLTERPARFKNGISLRLEALLTQFATAMAGRLVSNSRDKEGS